MANAATAPKSHAAAPSEVQRAAAQAKLATPLDQPTLRPLGYAWHFTKGTVNGLFNGMAKAGSKGMGLGVGVGLLMCIGSAGGFSVAYLMMGAVGGLLAGSAAGAAFGGLTGGTKDVNRARRLHKYADEAAEHQAARASRPAQGAAPATTTYRDTYEAKRRINDFNFVRAQQGERENQRDSETYWQDRERGHTHSGWGRGV